MSKIKKEKSPRQEELITLLVELCSEVKNPTLVQIRDKWGYGQRSSAKDMLDRLERNGHIFRNPSSRRITFKD